MLKVKNNGGQIIEVSQSVWEILYKNREGFSLYVEQAEKDKEDKTEKVATKSKPKAKLTARQKAAQDAKKVSKDDKSK